MNSPSHSDRKARLSSQHNEAEKIIPGQMAGQLGAILSEPISPQSTTSSLKRSCTAGDGFKRVESTQSHDVPPLLKKQQSVPEFQFGVLSSRKSNDNLHTKTAEVGTVSAGPILLSTRQMGVARRPSTMPGVPALFQPANARAVQDDPEVNINGPPTADRVSIPRQSVVAGMIPVSVSPQANNVQEARGVRLEAKMDSLCSDVETIETKVDNLSSDMENLKEQLTRMETLILSSLGPVGPRPDLNNSGTGNPKPPDDPPKSLEVAEDAESNISYGMLREDWSQ